MAERARYREEPAEAILWHTHAFLKFPTLDSVATCYTILAAQKIAASS